MEGERMKKWSRLSLLMAVLFIMFQILPVSAREKNEIVKIVVPTELPFLIVQQPGGERNIISGDFDFINYGNVDVEFLIRDIKCNFKNEEEYVQISTPAAISEDSLNKEVFMYFEKADIEMEENENSFIRRFARSDQTVTSRSTDSNEQVLTDRLKETAEGIAVLDENDVVITTGGAVSCKVVLKAAHYEDGRFVRLNPESVFSFRLAGFVNPNPAVLYDSDDIELQLSYSWSQLKQEELLETGNIEPALDSHIIEAELEEEPALNEDKGKKKEEVVVSQNEAMNEAEIKEKSRFRNEKTVFPDFRGERLQTRKALEMETEENDK